MSEASSTRRLAYITSMATGGLAGFNARELRELDSLGEDVSVYVTKYRSGPYMPPDGMAVHRLSLRAVAWAQCVALLGSPYKYLTLLLHAVRFGAVVDFCVAVQWSRSMRSEERTWIHCHWGDHKLFVGYYCSRITGLPLSVTVHGYELYDNPNDKMFGEALRGCDAIITISNHNRNLLSLKFPEVASRLKVVRLSADLPPQERLVGKVTRVLAVGGFHSRKGYQTLLEALNLLGRNDIELWIVGYKGPVDVPGLVAKYRLEGQVTIFGHVSDKVLEFLYRSCDVFCLPSCFGPDGIGEGLPVALMEAMAYGKPIISTKHTAIPELVPEILVAENDSQGLASAIARLAADPGLREQLGRTNRKIIERDYSNRNVQTLLDMMTAAHTSEIAATSVASAHSKGL